MNYHNITYDDMLNGDGLRVVLWISGCSHKCKGCHNPQTHSIDSGLCFDELAECELFERLDKDYIDGITFSGGDPLHENNVDKVLSLVNKIKKEYPSKTIWLYSGYTKEEIFNKTSGRYNATRLAIVEQCDVFVDGKFVESLKDSALKWVGSSNQNIYKKGIDY